ncbi:Adaptor protein complex AP-2 alpha subunit [Tilletiaria anomala UBC 951]|uniref:AP-2 complex subunit alpha n=1 Tax=Tilletiaria anomala (strain ATCC 24038 / CBS 436.72 / UBC 951) TaxID=1037660 RepID=A0A066VIU1_TILAU|nr:Adaptor protein complex AP-2 alpha subunit [Tilletiaria anomala UBC 951]KDN38649.1 Adaptor protein complex AP-2 alpha subunit [Tilletiaria anomala UBC 951]
MSSNVTSSMKGLTQYIADLRQARVRENEEKRINFEMAKIRQKFKDGNLDGYDKKKYLAKIIFTYILGYPVDVGHMEAINLIASPKYSEKQIGYLAITLLMHENSDLVRLVVNSIRKDLDDKNEINNCLALHAIANIGGKEMAEALVADVHRLLISPTSCSFVKKKAALTLLRLYRKHVDIFPAEEWASRIVSLMDEENLGVALAVTSLVVTLAQEHTDAYSIAYQKAVDRLARTVLEEDYSNEYVYYRVPVPWLQIKCLRLLQYYPPSDDPTIRKTINEVLEAIIAASTESAKNVQHNNAQKAVLFEAINLAIHIDTESTVVSRAAVLLGRFILSRETNIRYLGLDTMAHLAACAESLEPIKMHQSTIIQSLKDRDISVRRRGLDLLYSMCDVTNAKVIVTEMLRYLSVADYAMREELVLKIAILTEKFATEYAWYIDTVLQLISSAGDHVGEEVWFRVIQIVTNNEDVQEYAATKCLEHLKSPACHENMIKVGGYILGEFGHLIANNEGASPIEQFHALHSRSHLCTRPTRALLLSTYVKWLNLFPEIREQVLYVLKRYRHVLDAELQQRACEYVALAERPDDELLQIVCDEMPPFSEKASLLLNRLHSKHGNTEDKRTWVIGGKDSNRDRQQVRQQSAARGAANGGAMPAYDPKATLIQSNGHSDGCVTAGTYENGTHGGADRDDILAGLEGLDMSINGSGEAASAEAADGAGSAQQPLINHEFDAPSRSPTSPIALQQTGLTVGINGGPDAPKINFTPGFDRHFRRLCFAHNGVLYEDSQLQIGVKAEYHDSLGRLAVYFGNKIAAPFTSFTVTVRSQEPEALSATMPTIPSNTVVGMSQIQQVVELECIDFFKDPPVMRVSYLAGSLQEITLRLPVVLTKFIEPVQLGQADFFERWRQIGGPPRESQKVFGFKLTSSGDVDIDRNRKVVSGARFKILEGIDPNPVNIVAAGVLHMAHAGKVGCLLRVEPNKTAKLCRITVRTTNDVISEAIMTSLVRNMGDEKSG